MKKILLLTWIICIPAFSQETTPLPSQEGAGVGLPLSLQDCRHLALENNEKVKTADNAVEKAKLDRQIAFAQYLPKVDGSFTMLHMQDQDLLEIGDVVGVTLQTRGTFLAGINITQPIYVGGKLTAANRLARIGQAVSEEQQRKIRMQIIADVDNAYYTLVSVRSKVQMLEAYARQMQGLYDKVQLAVDVQMATENDLLRVSTKQNEVDYQLQKARNGEQLCGLALANLIGTDFEQTIIPTDTVFNSQFTIHNSQLSDLSEEFSSRPDLILLQQQVRASEVLVKKERSNYLPTVALVGSYTYHDNLKLAGELNLPTGTTLGYNHTFSGGCPYALLSLKLPVFHWGAELKKVKKAKLNLSDSRLQLQQLERSMRVEVRRAVQNVTDGQRMVETATVGRQQADENLRVMRQKYDNQLCTMTDLLDAQSQWQQAHSNLIEAQTQLKIYETEYLRVTGRLE
ncbi:MAG: TolC family protein [Bacteroidaceae bacterium]|nr:TolC family protein [Bacteroidaceae bacterium]